MKIILLSGGSGKRLWPLSNDQRSKQFIKVLKNNKGDLESMAQRVWNQLRRAGLQEDTYIATGKNQKSILKSQLNIEDSKIITEPNRRDTFPAIALASSYLYSSVQADLEETIIVLPVDPFVDDAFFEKVKELDDLLNATQTTLGLIGIRPTYPSSKYGYIMPKKEKIVAYFKEKPSEKEAVKLIDDNAVWNAGVFAFKLKTMKKILNQQNIEMNYESLCNEYEVLNKNSFDYEFVEKQSSISYIVYEGYWKDLGTWNTLTEEMATSSVGKVEMIDSVDTHVINETNLPVAAIGVSDLVIAAGPEGILVAKKDYSPRVKEINELFFETVHFKEEDWGISRLIHHTQNSNIVYYELFPKKTVHLVLNENQKLNELTGNPTITKKCGNFTVSADENVVTFIIITEEL